MLTLILIWILILIYCVNVFHKDWNEDRLGEVLDVFKRQVQRMKDKGAKDLPLQIIVLDDVADNVKLKIAHLCLV